MLQILLEWEGLSVPIFMVTGSCQGMEIYLDTDSLPFSQVARKCSSMRKLILHNTGDIGAPYVLFHSLLYYLQRY